MPLSQAHGSYHIGHGATVNVLSIFRNGVSSYRVRQPCQIHIANPSRGCSLNCPLRAPEIAGRAMTSGKNTKRTGASRAATSDIGASSDKLSPSGADLRRTSSRRSTAFPIVGIGASAGGLEAFTELLQHLPADTGMAYVLVQHLDPYPRERQLTNLLSGGDVIALSIRSATTCRWNRTRFM